jgi:hypothetical protein
LFHRVFGCFLAIAIAIGVQKHYKKRCTKIVSKSFYKKIDKKSNRYLSILFNLRVFGRFSGSGVRGVKGEKKKLPQNAKTKLALGAPWSDWSFFSPCPTHPPEVRVSAKMPSAKCQVLKNTIDYR